ncbi:MAG: oligosaccharide flippase family protein [Candidatus Thermoplasmatota archaeon]|nr:oligosaccharide flippase family protein [Candidatus Thermoplasmatota archaeon]
MRTGRELVGSASMIGAGNVAGQIMAFLFFMILAREMGRNEYGEVRFIIGIASLAAVTLSAGLPTTMTHFLAKNKDDKRESTRYFSTIIAMFLAALLITELFVFVLFWHNPIVLLVVLGYSLPLLYMGIARGRMQYKKYSLLTAFGNAAKLGLFFVFFYSIGISKPVALLIFSFGSWIALLALEILWPIGLKFRWRNVSKKTAKEVLPFSMVVLSSTLAYTILTQIPLIFLGITRADADVAIYSVAFTLSVAYTIIPVAILTITLPDISSSKKKNVSMRIFKRSAFAIILSGLLLLLGTIFFGRWLLEFLFTDVYVESYLSLVVLSVGSIFLGLRNAFGALWQGGGRPKFSAYDAILGASVALASSTILIPIFGPLGAASAYTLGWMSSVLLGSIFWLQLKRGRIRIHID